MKRILFVDDEPRILQGLRRMLRGQRHEWEMLFAEGGEAAIAELERAPVDVLVSDMRMPGIDGAALLAHAQKHHPDTVRIILSGFSELEAALRAVPIAHQFLSKPCEATKIREVVERACGLQTVLGSESLRRAIGEMDSLPTLPSVYAELTRILAEPETCTADVAELISQDVGMCAKILQIVNSSFFGPSQVVSDVQQAVTYLGTRMIANLVLSVEVFRPFEGKEDVPGFSLESFQAHSLATAQIAEQIASDKKEKEDAFMAGMLHDIGQLVLMSERPDEFRAVWKAHREQKVPIHVVEHGLSQIGHAETGAYLLGIWGLPYPIVEAVARHHDPDQVKPREFDVLSIVHVANGLAHEIDRGEEPGDDPPEGVALAYLESLGVADRLPRWREIARRVVAGPAGEAG